MDPNLCDFVFTVRVRQGDVIIEAKYVVSPVSPGTL